MAEKISDYVVYYFDGQDFGTYIFKNYTRDQIVRWHNEVAPGGEKMSTMLILEAPKGFIEKGFELWQVDQDESPADFVHSSQLVRWVN